MPPRQAPGPRPRPLLGQLPELARDLLGFFLGLAREHGPVARFAYGRVPAYLLSRAEHVHHVLISEARRFSKGTPGFRNLSALLGQGLVTSEGALWKRQRRTIEPLFAPERVAGFVDAMEVECRTTLDQWEELARRGATIDLSADMTRLALRIVGTTLLGADLAPEAERMGDSVAIALAWAREQTYSPLRTPLWIPTPANLRAKAAVRQIDRVVGSLVEARLGAPGVRADLLSLLLSARDPETGASMDPAQVRDEVATLFVAGHETTANLLAWTWVLLARVPAVARRMRRELREVLADRRVAAGDLGRASTPSDSSARRAAGCPSTPSSPSAPGAASAWARPSPCTKLWWRWRPWPGDSARSWCRATRSSLSPR